ncbi:unnamed protein product [Cladocopium goreaui]|uniref:Kinesin-like protein n=1 Tax=Cladocopium goreaui TaxID=2562237 RepID=A0A9P1FH49_9DINO|nr:unnamed protein product [Cladocopium goreaui]
MKVADDRSILVRVGPSGHQWRKYVFDACLPDDRSQKQVFQDSGVVYLLDEALAGYAATVLAYGQTGSGKTYTMMGRSVSAERNNADEVKKSDGMIMRAARRLFRHIGEMSNARVTVTASFAEIFNAPGAVNECICDLLNPDAGNLQVRFSQKHGFFISDLAVMECTSIADVRSVLEAGMANRRVSAHALNRESSRTHALFALHIDCEKFAEDDGSSSPTRTYGKVTFVDLAGSERLKESLSEGNARKETQAINKSLFTLGQVISQLSQGRPERHVPYRNSKLTQLLQDSFGGSALCLMVTCISPPSAFAEETVNSLNYAQKAMNIQNTPILQLDEQQRVLLDLRSENAQLRRELQGYKHRFGALEGGYAEDAGPTRGGPTASVDVGDLRATPFSKASPRGHSLPPDFSPQAPETYRPPLPSAVASPNSARSGSREGSGSGGSYALAAVKRQQLKAPHGPTRSTKSQGKQLPPLPQRGSTSGSAPGGVRAEAAPNGLTPCSWPSRRPSKSAAPSGQSGQGARELEEVQQSVSEPCRREPVTDGQTPKVFRGSREITEEISALTVEQLDYLDRAKWSEWQVDFGPPAVPQHSARAASATSSSSSEGDVQSDGSEPDGSQQELMPSPTAPPEPVRAARHSEDMSLAELNLKLASMARGLQRTAGMT